MITSHAPRAASWLTALWEQRGRELSPNHYLQIVLAIWLDEHLHHSSEQQIALTAMASNLYRTDAWGQALAHETDPELLLLVLIALRHMGQLLESFVPHLLMMADALDQALQSQAQALLPIACIQRRLQVLLPNIASANHSTQPRIPIDIARIYDCSDQAISDLCNYIAVVTDFGHRNDPIDRETRTILEESLPAISLAYLRDFKINHACDVLRSLHYLGMADLVSSHALPFLRLLQQTDGSFGLLSLRARRKLGQRNADIDLEVYLPTTLTCLWTLTIYEHGFDPFMGDLAPNTMLLTAISNESRKLSIESSG